MEKILPTPMLMSALFVAEVGCEIRNALFYHWSLLRINNMAKNLLKFTSIKW